MKKYRELAEAFFSFRPLKPAHSHDEIAVSFGEARWEYLSTVIATLSRSLSGRMVMVWLCNNNDKHQARRLNAILDYLSEMGVSHGVRYHAVKIAGRGRPVEMVYVSVGGRKFMNCDVSLIVDLETKRAEVFANEDDEVAFFRDSPELKELGRRISEANKTITHLDSEIGTLIAELRSSKLPPELLERYRKLLYDEYGNFWTDYNQIAGYLIVKDSYMIGTYARYLDRIKTIPEMVGKLADIRKKFAELAVYARLIS